MPNIFQYKPELKYILDDINTIDNISDKELKVEESYIRNRNSLALELLDENIRSISDLKYEVDKRLKNVSVKYKNRPVDESLHELVATKTDGDIYISEGSISYGLYKDCLKESILSPIVDEWERYHTDINGLIEGELYPYLLELEEDNRVLKESIETLVGNVDKLKEKELLNLESMLKAKNERDQAFEEDEIDVDRIRKLEKKIDIKEAKIEMEKDIAKMAKQYAREAKRNINAMGDLLKKENQDNRNKMYADQAKKLKDGLNTPIDHTKLLVYQGFKTKRDSFYSKKRENKNLYSKTSKVDAKRAFCTNTALYSKIAIPALVDMTIKLDIADLAPGIKTILDGVDDISKRKEASILNMKNVITANNAQISDHLRDIDEKDRARNMYKNLKH